MKLCEESTAGFQHACLNSWREVTVLTSREHAFALVARAR